VTSSSVVNQAEAVQEFRNIAEFGNCRCRPGGGRLLRVA
jgi:hypothetical protein